MKIKAILILFLAIILGSSPSTQAQTNRQVKIQINQTKRIFRNNLTVKFVSLVEDSRCPVDANCVWAGNAKIQIKVINARGVSRFFELNTNLKPQAIKFSSYEIKLIDLNPKPRTNIRINRNGYVATMIVSRVG